MKVLFMGTPEIAAKCLLSLLDAGADVVGVVTRIDKPQGRKMILTPPPVKVAAEARGIPVYQPATLRDEAFSELLKELSPDLITVVAFGKILPKNVLDFPKYGCINLHVSLLPKYRGAAPMQRAVMNGETETGVTLMYMDEGLDTGDIIKCEKFPIGASDDFGTVAETSAEIGAKLLADAVLCLQNGGTLPRTKQDDALATYADKIEKADCRIDFHKSAKAVDAFIRGLSPVPVAFTTLKGAALKILKAAPAQGAGEPGEVIAVEDRGEGSFTVACGEGALRVTHIVPEGKGKMTAGDFIRGRKIAKGDKLV